MNVFVIYKTDAWLSADSKKVAMVAKSKKKAISVLKRLADQPMTEEQAEQLENMNQSQCNDVGYEWKFEEVPLSEVLL